MAATSIAWTEQTWNPLAGCKEVSPGCEHCYAAKMAHRLAAMGQRKYMGTTKKLANGNVVWTGKINLNPGALTIPLKRKKPTMYFVNSMSDLFHEEVPDHFIDKVFAVMALCPQHTFQVLTKRAERMRDYLSDTHQTPSRQTRWEQAAYIIAKSPCAAGIVSDAAFPLPNVWLGVSVEDQQRADERIPLLTSTPAAVRFLSCEPLLGPLDNLVMVSGGFAERPIDWVIIGCESGPERRPMKHGWAEYIVHQCKQAVVPVFMKQMEIGGKVFDDPAMFPYPLRVREYPKTTERTVP